MTSPKKALLLFRPDSYVVLTLKEVLEFENFYEVTIMDNPILALKHLKENPTLYTVICLELMLYPMDGVTTMEKIKALQITTPIIITSFHLTKEKGKKLEDEGAFKYFENPPDLNYLLDLFQQAADYNQKLISTHTGK